MGKLIKYTTSFMLAVAFTTVVDGIYQEAQSAGVVYTIPADYEKMKKAVEGLIGKKTNEVTLSQAQNAGTNVRQFVESASEMEGNIRSSDHNAFKYAGRNYVNTMEQMVGADINSENTRRWGGKGANISNAYYYYGQNVKSFMEGVTGKSVYQNNANAYSNAGKNIKSFMEGIGGSGTSITGSYANTYKYAGQNIATLGKELSGGTEITTSDTSGFQTNISNFKKRADQTFYDTYLNDKALKKSFKFASGFDPTKYKAGLTTITTSNKAEFNSNSEKILGELLILVKNGTLVGLGVSAFRDDCEVYGDEDLGEVEIKDSSHNGIYTEVGNISAWDSFIPPSIYVGFHSQQTLVADSNRVSIGENNVYFAYGTMYVKVYSFGNAEVTYSGKGVIATKGLFLCTEDGGKTFVKYTGVAPCAKADVTAYKFLVFIP